MTENPARTDSMPSDSGDLDGFGCAVAATIRGKSPENLKALLDEPELRLTLERIRRLEAPCTADTLSHIGAIVIEAERPAIPRRLANHDLCCQIGQGGMGVVYLARNRGLKSFRAIKLLSPERINSPKAVARFRQEFVKTGLISGIPDAGFVTAYDAGEADGWHYLVMDYIDGQDLAANVWKNGPLPVAAAAEVVRRAAFSLAKAHEHPDEPVHRDLKPSNMMLTPEGQVRILDFGLTRIAQDAADESMNGGGIVGTLQYMAPEQLRGEHAVDVRSDIYSLGATFFHLLTGRPPHALKSSQSRAEQVISRLTEPALSIRDVCPDLPEPLTTLIESMLCESSSERPQSMRDVADTIAAFASDDDLRDWAARTVTAQLPSLSELQPETASVAVDSLSDRKLAESTSETAPSTGIRKWTSLIAVLILAGILIAAISQSWNRKPSQPDIDSDLIVNPALIPEPALSSEPVLAPESEPEPVAPQLPDEWTSSAFQAVASSTPPIEEPPPLEEWLTGKKRILTVKQDGTADFSRIQDAVLAVRTDEVIEILDTGPYPETIRRWRFPTGSGVFSRVGTVIIPDRWDFVDNTEQQIINHGLTAISGLRFSGLNFHAESMHGSVLMQLFACGELVIENCAFMLNGHTVLTDSVKPPYILFSEANTDGLPTPFRLVIRDCVIAPQIKTSVRSSTPQPSSVTMVRNLFRTPDECALIVVGLDCKQATEGQVRFVSNIIHSYNWPLAAVVPSQESGSVAGSIFLDRNTIYSVKEHPFIANWGKGANRDDVSLRLTRNVVSVVPQGWASGHLYNPGSSTLNLIPARHPQLDPDHELVARITLPTDVSRRDYMRISSDSEVGKLLRERGADCIPGALPLDDPDRPDDWFDRLRQRWIEQNAVSLEIEDRLRSVKRPVSGTPPRS